MFNTKQTLIVVYEDELLLNQLKKLVETSDDSDGSVVGTRDDSINIVSWTEKVFADNKKAGNIKDKVLYLGNIKGTDKLIPVLDIAFEDCGVKYGWAGNQAVLFVDPKALTDRKAYDDFLVKLSELPVPEFLKPMRENVVNTGEDDNTADEEKNKWLSNLAVAPLREKSKFAKIAEKALSDGADIVGKVGGRVAEKTEEIFRNKKRMERQMLFYGVVRLYNDGLQRFMDM